MVFFQIISLAERMFLIVLSCFFVNACWASLLPNTLYLGECDLRVQSHDICIDPGDREGPCSKNMYAQGALWLRDQALFCCPHGYESSCRAHKRSEYWKLAKGTVPDPLCFIFACMDSRMEFKDFVSKRYPLMPYNDILSAVVPHFRWLFSHRGAHPYGEFNSEFSSWACFFPDKKEEEHKVIVCADGNEGSYGPGSIWICWSLDKPILCYIPENGPTWMQYRYGLESQEALGKWPQHCLFVPRVLRHFSSSSMNDFSEYIGEDFGNVVCSIKDFFAGKEVKKF